MAKDRSKYQQDYRAEHKEHIAELKRRWYERNKEDISARRKVQRMKGAIEHEFI